MNLFCSKDTSQGVSGLLGTEGAALLRALGNALASNWRYRMVSVEEDVADLGTPEARRSEADSGGLRQGCGHYYCNISTALTGSPLELLGETSAGGNVIAIRIEERSPN